MPRLAVRPNNQTDARSFEMEDGVCQTSAGKNLLNVSDYLLIDRLKGCSPNAQARIDPVLLVERPLLVEASPSHHSKRAGEPMLVNCGTSVCPRSCRESG